MKAAIWGVVLGLACAVGAPAWAQDTNLGADLYATSCALCHGASGEGDGDFGQYLTVEPANLTTLTAQNDGVFPYLAIFEVIDGRMMVGAHGASGMPIWGTIFERELGALSGTIDTDLLVRARIVALVDYVRSLQAE